MSTEELTTADGVRLMVTRPTVLYEPQDDGSVTSHPICCESNGIGIYSPGIWAWPGELRAHAIGWVSRWYADERAAREAARQLRRQRRRSRAELLEDMTAEGYHLQQARVTDGDCEWYDEILTRNGETGYILACYNRGDSVTRETWEIWFEYPLRRGPDGLWYTPDAVMPPPDECPRGGEHNWSMLSHEEKRCRQCGEAQFVPDL